MRDLMKLMVAAGCFAAFLSVTTSGQDFGPAGRTLAEVSRQAWQMAAEGKFDEAVDAIRQAPKDPNGDPQYASLLQHIESHEAREQQRWDRVHSLYVDRTEEMHARAEKGEWQEAINAAIEAHDLAEVPAAFLEREDVKEIVAKTEAEAEKHQRDGDWLEALALYRGLNLLFDDHDSYVDELKRVAQRVRLLRLYAPDVLFEMYKKRAEEKGEDPPTPWTGEDKPWERQFDGIEANMLREAIGRAERQHIEAGDFESLITGTIDSLQVLLTTPNLDATFPNLSDEDAVGRFLLYLDEQKASIERREGAMTFLQASTVINNILRKNGQTLRLPEAVLIHEMAEGSMNTLDDFSAVIWPAQRDRFERTTKGKFSGVGIQIVLAPDGQLTVVTPLDGTPAHSAGIKPGDRIVSIDDKNTTGITLNQAVDQITGPEGTEVVLGIRRGTDGEVKDVRLTRATIRIESVKGWQREAGHSEWDFHIDPALKVGYLRVTQFGPNTAGEMDRAFTEMKNHGGVNGLILDLRFNPGGLLSAAVEMSNRFIDSGMIVSTTKTSIWGHPWKAMADKRQTYRRDANSETPDFPVVVLINKGSASASEIVAGCLQAHDRAIIVGERSYGKGSVQNLYSLSGGEAYLKLTTQYYITAANRIIHRRPGSKAPWGIDPDVRVRMTSEQTRNLIEARMVLDVLRDSNEQEVDLTSVLHEDKKKDGEDGDVEEIRDDAPPEITSAGELISDGIDPQLEAALLLLKTRLVANPQI